MQTKIIELKTTEWIPVKFDSSVSYIIENITLNSEVYYVWSDDEPRHTVGHILEYQNTFKLEERGALDQISEFTCWFRIKNHENRILLAVTGNSK